MRRDPRETHVTIFGAGIAGMSAAHELAVRGFNVEVIDPDINAEILPRATLDRGIGGMARSQWVCDLFKSGSNASMRRLWPAHDVPLDDTVVFQPDATPLDEARASEIIGRLGKTLLEIQRRGLEFNVLSIQTPVASPEDPSARFGPAPSPADRLDYVRRILSTQFPQLKIDLEKIHESPEVNHNDADQCRWLYVYTGASTLPGEHGFRFFPSFYRHLFDTMKRTPLLHPRISEYSHATVYDNLVSTEGLGFARGGKARSFIVPRREIRSLEQIRDYLGLVLAELEYTLEDIARFQLKILKYMTSSSERREREYENMSWGRFLEQEKYSPISRQHIEFGPQMSAALRGSSSDARTQGNITIQLLLDQLKINSHTDATLNGPSSGAWLDHWYDHLSKQRVTFTRDRLMGFAADGTRVRPVLASPRILASDGYVIALSLPEIVKLAPSFAAFAVAAEASGEPLARDNDFAKIVQFANQDLTEPLPSDLTRAAPKGPLQHLSGIQYYFDTDVRIWPGHTQYLDSEWGLTSIAQPQFWGRPRDYLDGYRAILSVDIGIWDRPYKGRIAWSCTADEIAQFAWEQILDHHDDAFKQKYGRSARFPEPFAYALDYSLAFIDGQKKQDRTPFLVNRVGRYRNRPGLVRVSEQSISRSKCISLYSIYAEQYVLAGTFMQTYTRLTSMEAANESARHAVNALLSKWRIRSDRCDIWDPEDNELPDLAWFKELDRSLLSRGLPHFMDILGWQRLPEQIVPGDLIAKLTFRRSGK